MVSRRPNTSLVLPCPTVCRVSSWAKAVCDPIPSGRVYCAWLLAMPYHFDTLYLLQDCPAMVTMAIMVHFLRLVLSLSLSTVYSVPTPAADRSFRSLPALSSVTPCLQDYRSHRMQKQSIDTCMLT